MVLRADNEALVDPLLKQLGYQSFFANQMAELSPELLPARVIGQHRREWDVASTKGTARAVLAGKHWAKEHVGQIDDAQPTVGDWVAVRWDDDAPPVILHMLERRTSLTRTSAARRGARQTLVANVDQVAVVAAFAHPGTQDAVAKRSLHPRRIERYVTAIEKGRAKPLVILNKSDLSDDAESTRAKLESRLKNCKVICASCVGDNGLSQLLDATCPGQTIGLVGLSGVGKSSLVNRILGREAQKIGAERIADSRGRHTTTHRELFVTESQLLLIDTPGMREFAVADGAESDLKAFFDIIELGKSCQFRDCTHQQEPGCHVVKAAADGGLEADRLESYRALAEELKQGTAAPTKRVGRQKRQKYPKRSDRLDWDD